MTRENAILCLKGIKNYGRDTFTEQSDWQESLDMAIKALEQEPILDKIREEIEQLRLHKAQFITNDNKVCIDSQEVLNIIDKYKAEQEET